MAVVAPPGAVATALRHVRYRKQARSASDTRPHRAVPVAGAHRSRSLTCILIPGIDAALARSSAHCSTSSTRYRHEYRETYEEYLSEPACVAGSTLAVP